MHRLKTTEKVKNAYGKALRLPKLNETICLVKTPKNPQDVYTKFLTLVGAECAVDAEISTNGFAPGHIYSAEITLKYKNVDQVFLTVSRKNDDGSYTEIATDIFVNLPDDDGVFRIDLNNGFRVAAGETYLFTFVGCVDGLSVCHDVCYAVIGYGR